MLFSIPSTDGTRRRRLIVAAAAVLLILGDVASYALVAHRHHTGPSPFEASSGSPAGDDMPAELEQSAAIRTAIVAGSDPETFARRVALALFVWDTATTTPAEVTDRLVTVADPTGESSAGLVADIANYLPTIDAWTGLRQYQTRQWIELTSLDVPSLWHTAVQQAGADGLLPGTAAYTIHGVRHREGIWESEPVHTAHNVSFTVFVVCAPAYPQCHLLRLSRLDEPLS